MSISNLHHLLYRRQYLIVPEYINCPFIHLTRKITDRYVLYTHRDLKKSEMSTPEKKLVLLGDMFDYEDPIKDNMAILKDLSAVSFDVLLEMVGKYSGRFVLVHIEDGKIILLHDSTASRKIYYSNKDIEPWFCSQPHLLASIKGLSKSTDPSKLGFYQSADFIFLDNSNLGDTTIYDDISQLMPNHYFDLSNNSVIRYWPSSRIEKQSFGEAAEKCAQMVKGYMESISNRYKLMLPVTAGSDSRLLMSATRNFKEDVLYYINLDKGLTEHSLDVRTPKRLFHSLGMNFELLTLPAEIDALFKQVYFENNPMASNIYLPHIYNYYLSFSDRVNIPGNIASAPWGVYEMNTNKVTIKELCKYNGVCKYDFARDYYQKWWNDSHELCRDSNLNVINLYYWEERLGNWGTQISIDKDIAQEEFNPFNSRLLNEIFLSVPLKYNNEPDKLMHKRIIGSLWPELMKMPFNPSFWIILQLGLTKLGLLTPLKKMRYRLSGWLL